MAAIPENEPTSPLPDDKLVPCHCGTIFTAQRFGTRYLPEECTDCRAKTLSARAVPTTQRLRIHVESPPELTPEEAALREERLADAAARARSLEEQQREDRMAAAMRGLQVPELYQGVTLDSFDPTDDADPAVRLLLLRVHGLAREYVARWPERDDLDAGFPIVTILRGGFGTGKNHIAWSIAKALVQARTASAKVIKCSDLIRHLREPWQHGWTGESEARRLERFRALDFLVIDEISGHALMGQPIQHLYDVIDHRQEWLRPTMLVTNEPRDGIAALLGPALVSRAAGWGGGWEFGERDYRTHRRNRLRAI